MASMWGGVVPQQPPTMFNQRFCAQSFNCGASDSGVSGKPVGKSGLGRPALGYALRYIGATLASSSTSGRSSFGPSAQFKPTLSNGTWEMEFQNASTVWPVTPRLLAAWINVTEAMIGTILFADPGSLGLLCSASLSNTSPVGGVPTVGVEAAARPKSDGISGSMPRSSNSFRIAKKAALALSVSKIVSTSSRSAPPSRRPLACSQYAAATSSNVAPR